MKKSKDLTTGSVTKKPIVVETIHSTAQAAEKQAKKQVFEKHIITGNLPVPEGHIRCIVLVDYKGMLDDLYVNDVLDMPDRRYKSLSIRGLVKEYKGPRIPNKQR
jgi:hypothetical protein